jgi:ABC-type Zn2+ transport system, periplasmic component/surface adhesin
MKYLKKIPFILSILSFLTIFTSANADLKVVASIKPIHSLASYLMDGIGKPDLIVEGYSSPHGFALKPSHAKMLQEADIIFYVGEGLENFLEKPLKSIAKKAEKIEFMEIKRINKLKFRERNIFDDHDGHGHKEDNHDDHGHDDEHKEDGHDDHGHDDEHKEDGHDDHGHDDEHKEDGHDDHGHDDEHKEDGHDDHGHDDEHKEDGHDDHGHEGHAHGEYDPHIWLDPSNAKIILNEMAEHLIENDQKNASTYKANLNKALKDIDKLLEDVKSELNKDFKSIVFHDAYQYFEKRFNVNVLGAFTVNTDV